MKRKKIEVELLDFMGSDQSIEKSARLSFFKIDEVRSEKQTKGLIRYLMWRRHTSPFEMCEVQFYMTIPLFVARQIIRHRTANVNEVSRRYTSEQIEFFDMELRLADTTSTKQGSAQDGVYDPKLMARIDQLEEMQLEVYNYMIEQGYAPEISRNVLDVNLMTTWIWKIDLHNLMHFMNLRLHAHAQKETRLVAQMIHDAIEDKFPVTIKAFDDWMLLTHKFMDVFYDYFKNEKIEEAIQQLDNICTSIEA